MLQKLLGKLTVFLNKPKRKHNGKPFEDFLILLDQLLEENNIEMPSIESSSGRTAYLEFLLFTGYQENELLPVIDTEKVTPEMYAAMFTALTQAINIKDKELIMKMAFVAKNTVSGEDNSNFIISHLSKILDNKLSMVGCAVPNYYAGVFPTDTCNAQAIIHNNECLVLIDTGYMEMAEGVVTCMFSKESTAFKVDELNSVIENYVVNRKRPSHNSFSSKDVDWGSGIVPIVINSVEEFVLAHELGHLSLGHLSTNNSRTLSPRFSESIEVVSKSNNQEFAADLWACKYLIHHAKASDDSDNHIMLVIAGVVIALGIGLLIECSKNKNNIPYEDGHPPSTERLYMIKILWELLETHHLAGLGEQFNDLLMQCINKYYPEAEIPAAFDIRLIKKIIPVLDILEIDYKHAAFINDFV